MVVAVDVPGQGRGCCRNQPDTRRGRLTNARVPLCVFIRAGGCEQPPWAPENILQGEVGPTQSHGLQLLAKGAPGDILSINKMDNGLGRGEGVSNAGYLCGSSVTSPSGPFLRKVLLGQAR